MRRKLIFLDLDDTLLSSDKSVTEENRRALGQALSAGHGIAIATGRSLRGGLRVMESLGLNRKGCFLLAFHGSMIYDCGDRRQLAAETMEESAAAELMGRLEESGIHAQAFDGYGIVTWRESSELWRYNRIAKEPVRLAEDLSAFREGRYFKVMAIDFSDHGKLERFRRSFASLEEGRLGSFFSNPWYLEYCKAGCDKGSGLKKLAATLEIPVVDTVAVGDEQNDIPMIRAAGTGAAMANGCEELRRAADYVTVADQNHSGVAEVIDKFVLKNS